jgi:hypothetical protein
MEPHIITGTPPLVIDWRCAIPNCRTLLGKKHSHGVLVVKYKDQITEISGNYTVNINCRRCGSHNSISTQSHGILELLK